MKKSYTIAMTVIITALLSFMTASAYYNGKLILKPGGMYRVSAVEEVLDKYYYGDYDKEKAFEEAAKGFVKSVGDPYTEYFSKEDLKNFNDMMNRSYCGIGVTVQNNTEDNTLLIIGVFEGSPAEGAGIKEGDIITKVNDVEYKGEQLEEATDNILGEEGTTVKITILKKSSGEETELDIERKNITVNSVDSEILENNIGYVSIASFANNTAAEFAKHMDDLMSKDIKGLIVDVRDNGGGTTSAVEAVADCLLPKGAVIYYTADKYNRKNYVKAKMSGVDIPLVVLANENSASASEILVGAVKDNGRGVVVGTKTFGKGIVQRLVELGDKTAVKVTVEKYFTPNGSYIHKKGIEPDYKVEIENNTDTQLKKALDILKNQ